MGDIIIIIFKPNPNPGILPAFLAAIFAFVTMGILDAHGIGVFLLWWLLYAFLTSIFLMQSLVVLVFLIAFYFFWTKPNHEKEKLSRVDKWYNESDLLTPFDDKYNSSLKLLSPGSQFTWDLDTSLNESIVDRPTSVAPELLPGGPKYYKKSVSALRGDQALVEIASNFSENTPPSKGDKVYPIVKMYAIQYCMEPNQYCKSSGQDTWAVILGKIVRPEVADDIYKTYVKNSE